MGLFYKKDKDNKTIGFTVSFKFGSGTSKQDKTADWASAILKLIEGFGGNIIKSTDEDPNNDKRIL